MRNQGIYYFNSHNEHETYINSEDYKDPYVCYDQKHIHYNKTIDYSKEYFTIEALEEGTIKAYINYYVLGQGNIYYSYNKTNWYSIFEHDENGQLYTNINVIKNQKVYFKGDYLPARNYNLGGLKFSSNVKFNVSGNILSLVYLDNFQNQKYLIQQSNLITSSSNSLWNYCNWEYNGVRCYRNMGDQYSGIFGGMFKDNTNLISAGNLVFSMKHVCETFSYMFYGCTSLVDFPQFIDGIVCWGDPFSNMFYGCTSLKKVEKFSPIFASHIRGANGSNSYCYRMFYGCSSLNYVKCLMTNPYESGTSEPFSMGSWLSGVSQTGTFVKRRNIYWSTGVSGIPSGWTVKNVFK